jgi:prolyl-tRNA synthetase
MGDTMFRLKDRKGAELCLGMTEEEVMTEIARKELRSYKQLPQIWYQIQSKFRDEPRPRAGLLRVRQFTMKDSYSFDLDAAGLDISYKKHYETYCRIFDRCGLTYIVVEAHSGAMGGSQSHEFMVQTDAGEDFIVRCPHCHYAANLEKATSRLETVEDYSATGDGKPELVHTPGMKTVEEVANYLGVSSKNKMKTLALMATETKGGAEKPHEAPVVVFLRGDHTLNEAKLSAALAGAPFRPMHAEEIQAVFGAPAGFLGPLGSEQLQYRGIKARVLVDRALLGRKNLIAGANKEDYHLRNITPDRDFAVSEWADLRSVEAGEGCPECGTPLQVAKAVEIGHIFKLGYKYSEALGARVLDQNGKEVAPIMGCYGIGIERILTAAIEQNHDNEGFWLQPAIAPFEVVVTPTNVADSNLLSTATRIAEELLAAGFDVLLDDRNERPGVKFKDADLVGIPFRVNVGKKVTEGMVEVVPRSTREIHNANIRDITSCLNHFVRPPSS